MLRRVPSDSISLLKQPSSAVREGNAPLSLQVLSARNEGHLAQAEKNGRKVF